METEITDVIFLSSPGIYSSSSTCRHEDLQKLFKSKMITQMFFHSFTPYILSLNSFYSIPYYFICFFYYIPFSPPIHLSIFSIPSFLSLVFSIHSVQSIQPSILLFGFTFHSFIPPIHPSFLSHLLFHIFVHPPFISIHSFICFHLFVYFFRHSLHNYKRDKSDPLWYIFWRDNTTDKKIFIRKQR